MKSRRLLGFRTRCKTSASIRLIYDAAASQAVATRLISQRQRKNSLTCFSNVSTACWWWTRVPRSITVDTERINVVILASTRPETRTSFLCNIICVVHSCSYLKLLGLGADDKLPSRFLSSYSLLFNVTAASCEKHPTSTVAAALCSVWVQTKVAAVKTSCVFTSHNIL